MSKTKLSPLQRAAYALKKMRAPLSAMMQEKCEPIAAADGIACGDARAAHGGVV